MSSPNSSKQLEWSLVWLALNSWKAGEITGIELNRIIHQWADKRDTTLAEEREQAARLNELKHRAKDTIGRMCRLDRDYADKFVQELKGIAHRGRRQVDENQNQNS